MGVPQINIHDAKTHLSRLVDKAAKGEPFVIAKAGKPMVKVVPLDAPRPDAPKRFGFLAGSLQVPDAETFNAMAADEIAAMFGTRP